MSHLDSSVHHPIDVNTLKDTLQKNYELRQSSRQSTADLLEYELNVLDSFVNRNRSVQRDYAVNLFRKEALAVWQPLGRVVRDELNMLRKIKPHTEASALFIKSIQQIWEVARPNVRAFRQHVARIIRTDTTNLNEQWNKIAQLYLHGHSLLSEVTKERCFLVHELIGDIPLHALLLFSLNYPNEGTFQQHVQLHLSLLETLETFFELLSRHISQQSIWCKAPEHTREDHHCELTHSACPSLHPLVAEKYCRNVMDWKKLEQQATRVAEDQYTSQGERHHCSVQQLIDLSRLAHFSQLKMLQICNVSKDGAFSRMDNFVRILQNEI